MFKTTLTPFGTHITDGLVYKQLLKISVFLGTMLLLFTFSKLIKSKSKTSLLDSKAIVFKV